MVMADTRSNLSAPAPLVAIAAWLVPGAGYWMIGQRTRGLAIGITVIAMFLAGLLIGGIRVVEVPGYGDNGERIHVKTPVGWVWVLVNDPMQEIRSKPWSIAQVLAGPLGIVSGAASIWSAQPNDAGEPHAKITHHPVNEAGTLYTAVAGMLNLLAIIDATHRATHGESGDNSQPGDRDAAASKSESDRRQEAA
jgi:hypothetical protein